MSQTKLVCQLRHEMSSKIQNKYGKKKLVSRPQNDRPTWAPSSSLSSTQAVQSNFGGKQQSQSWAVVERTEFCHPRLVPFWILHSCGISPWIEKFAGKYLPKADNISQVITVDIIVILDRRCAKEAPLGPMGVDPQRDLTSLGRQMCDVLKGVVPSWFRKTSFRGQNREGEWAHREEPTQNEQYLASQEWIRTYTCQIDPHWMEF